MGLEGQHVVVTGAGGGIGSVVARSLATGKTAANRALITGGESALVGRIPLGRAGQPGELVGAIGYLLSEDASFTTGAWIDIDGGYTLI
jgi:NAD(P)-dependent dehydrogenase (short-subunit alcohol dehydrogenase family)